mgnify:CR=1 FL=1
MNYGMYIAASGVSTQMARTDVMANNLANISTVGFRPDFLAVRARDVARVEKNIPFAESDALLERLGAGVMPMPTLVSQSQGPIQQTDRPLDFALEGQGFFLVSAGDGPDGMRLTRDGRFNLNAQGELVTGAGHRVLDDGGGTILLDSAQRFDVRGNGEIVQGGAVVGRLALRTVADPAGLAKRGEGLLGAQFGQTLQFLPASVQVHQNAVEGSSVDAIRTMMGVTGAARSASSGLRIISMINQNLGLAVGRLGRITG